MISLDVSRDWVILAPRGTAPEFAAAELSRILGLLRREAGHALGAVPVLDSGGDAPDETRPIIVLNGDGTRKDNGYSWRFGLDRIEIYGASDRGLLNGVFAFCAALGVSWPDIDRETLPPPVAGTRGGYALDRAGAYQPSAAEPAKLRRLVISRETPLKRRHSALIWGIHRCVDAVVLPLREKPSPLAALTGGYRRARERFVEEAETYGLQVELGGWDLACLVPRDLFTGGDVFRMEAGKRIRKYNFCPTNPKTIALLTAGAERFFKSHGDTAVFHLWPDRGAEDRWCSCPSCRAFSRNEQNRIAVNTATDVLARLNPDGLISYYEAGEDENAGDSDVKPRPAMFRIHTPSRAEGAPEAASAAPEADRAGILLL
jgi:hypothetical protein